MGQVFLVTKSTTLILGLPTPMNVNTSAVTNSSITLSWEYPPPPIQPIQSFLVSTTRLYIVNSYSPDLTQLNE